MPPQQSGGLLDVGDNSFDFRAHGYEMSDAGYRMSIVWGGPGVPSSITRRQYSPPVPVRTAPAAESGEIGPLLTESAPMTE